MPTCPECDAEIDIDEYDVDKGDLLSCPECGLTLEITGLSPIEFDVVAEAEEEAADADSGDESDDLGDDNEGEDEEKEEWDE